MRCSRSFCSCLALGTVFALAFAPCTGAAPVAHAAVVKALPARASEFGVSITPLGRDVLVSGYTSLAGGDTPLLLRLDRDGGEVWRRTLPANGDGALWSVCPLGDGTFIGVGWAKGSAGDLDAMAARFDSAGTVLWQRTYPGSAKERLWSVDRTARGVIAAGESVRASDGGSEALVLKIAEDGSELGRVTHGGQPVERVFSVQALDDGGYVLAGQSGSGPRESAGHDARIVRYDAGDRMRWSRVWGGAGYDVAHDVRRLAGGGFLVAGYSFAGETRGTDAFLLELTAAGAVRWSRRYGGSGDDRAVHAAVLCDGGFALIGYSQSDTSNWDVILRTTDRSGRLTWEQRFGGRGPELGRAIAATANGGLVAVGHSQSYGPYEQILFVRVDGAAARPTARRRGLPPHAR